VVIDVAEQVAHLGEENVPSTSGVRAVQLHAFTSA
jgi:hypothetical protein